MRRGITPLGAVTRGLAAGAAGAGFQSAFFKATSAITPSPPEDAFDPPEPQQKDETSTQTVARRAVESFAKRGPISEQTKARAGQFVHYGFGAMWGLGYGLARESLPWISTPVGVTAFASAVWMASDNVLLPAVNLAAPATRYPLKSHAYAWAAHLAYGFAVASVYEALRPRSRALLKGAAFGALAWWRLRRLPRPMRPALGRVVKASARSSSRWRTAGEGMAHAMS